MSTHSTQWLRCKRSRDHVVVTPREVPLPASHPIPSSSDHSAVSLSLAPAVSMLHAHLSPNHHDAPYSGSHVSCLSPTARNHLPHPRPSPQLNTLEDEERITSVVLPFHCRLLTTSHILHLLAPDPCLTRRPVAPTTDLSAGPPSASCTCSKGKTGKLTSGNAIESGVKPNRNKRNS